jgi:hypothetical protein
MGTDASSISGRETPGKEGKTHGLWKVREEDEEEGSQEDREEEEVSLHLTEQILAQEDDTMAVKKKTSKKPGMDAKKKTYYRGKEVRVSRTR